MKIEKHNLLIISPEHTYPESLEEALVGLGRSSKLRSKTIAAYVDEMGEDKLNEYFKVGLVRNPVERVTSSFVVDGDKLDRQHLMEEDTQDHMPKSYKEYFTYEGLNKIDFYIKWESFECDFNKLCDILDIENKRDEKPCNSETIFEKYYLEDTELICFLWEKYKWDIVSFGYDSLMVGNGNEESLLYNCNP